MEEPDVIVKPKRDWGAFWSFGGYRVVSGRGRFGGAVTISWEEETGSYSCSQTGEVCECGANAMQGPEVYPCLKRI